MFQSKININRNIPVVLLEYFHPHATQNQNLNYILHISLLQNVLYDIEGDPFCQSSQ